MEWAVCTASSDSEDTASQETNEEDGTPSNEVQQDSLHESLTDTPPPTDLMIDHKAASSGTLWDAVQWSAWVTSNYPRERTREINEDEGELSKWGQQDSLNVGKIEVGGEYPAKDTQQPTDLMIDHEAAPTRSCWDPVQWPGWEASSYPKEAVTPEMNKKEGEFSHTGPHDSLNEQKIEVGESTTNTAQRSIDMMMADEIASIRNCWSFGGSVKAEAGEKLPDEGSRDLVQFKKREGNKLPAPDCMDSTCKANISARDGTSNSDPEGLTMQMMHEDGEESVLVTQEDSEESAEELDFSTNGVSQKLSNWRSEVQRKKRNLTEDGQGQASKLVKRLEHPQENQVPGATTEHGENSTDPSLCQQSQYTGKSWYESWFESYQTRHLDGIHAAREPSSCTDESKGTNSRLSEFVEHPEQCATTESKDIFSQSSESHKPQEDSTIALIYSCKVCKITFKNLNQKRTHHLTSHKRRNPYKCPDCSARFLKTGILKKHLIWVHNIHETFDCAYCKAAFSKHEKWSRHVCPTSETLPFKCKYCPILLKDVSSLRKHQKNAHGERPYKCTECIACFSSASRLRQHHKCHNMEK